MDSDDPQVPEQRPQFHTLKQAARELGISYKQARALQRNGFFGNLARGGEHGHGHFLVPEVTLQRLRRGEQLPS